MGIVVYLKMLGIAIGWMIGVVITAIMTWYVLDEIFHCQPNQRSGRILVNTITSMVFFIWPIFAVIDACLILVHLTKRKLV